jgi:hypothetical protein
MFFNSNSDRERGRFGSEPPGEHTEPVSADQQREQTIAALNRARGRARNHQGEPTSGNGDFVVDDQGVATSFIEALKSRRTAEECTAELEAVLEPSDEISFALYQWFPNCYWNFSSEASDAVDIAISAATSDGGDTYVDLETASTGYLENHATVADVWQQLQRLKRNDECLFCIVWRVASEGIIRFDYSNACDEEVAWESLAEMLKSVIDEALVL